MLGSGALPPFFVFGFERSGNTLLAMMLGAHPDIAVPLSVTGLWHRYAERLADYAHLATPMDGARIVDDLLAEERIRLWDARLTRAELLDHLPCGDYPALIRRFHERYAAQHGKCAWGMSDIATLYDMDQAYHWFPDARFIHIVRDGRDVALSHQTYRYGIANTLVCAEHWQHEVQVNLKMGAIIGPTRYRVVRYEDLVLDTERTLHEICAFLAIGYAPEMLQYPKMVQEKIPATKRFLWPALAERPRADKAYGWRTRMSRTKRIVFEGAAGMLLRQLGYDTYPQLPKSLRAYAFEVWCACDRGGRWGRLVQRLRPITRS